MLWKTAISLTKNWRERERERERAFTHASNEDCAFICFQNIEEEFPVLGFVQDNQELLSTQQEIKALTKH